MKKALCLVLTFLIACGMLSSTVFAENGIKVLLDGEELVFDVSPQLINDRTMVPMRKIFESMGAEVAWDGDTKTVTAIKGDTTVIMQIENNVIKVNGEDITLDVAPIIADSRTLVPLRAVAESLKAKVDWDGETKTVFITSPSGKGEEIYNYPNPTVDFSNDDGTMSKLHLELRKMFEQTVFPKSIFQNAEYIKDAFVNDPETFLAYVDNDVWGISMNTVIIRYMEQSDEEYTIENEEDIYKHINDIADKYSLHAYQNYEIDALKLTEDKYMMLFSMADIYDDLKVPELDKLLLSNYISVVYDAVNNKFSYYLLEKSLDGNYAFCSINENLEHTTIGIIQNNKKAFVESVYYAEEQ